MEIVAFVAFIVVVIFVSIFFFRRKKNSIGLNESVKVEDAFLQEHVLFYRNLSQSDRLGFIEKVKRFLQRTKITGVDTEVSDQDKLLIASGAVIPMFRFKGWYYANLQEILVYSDTFNHDFESRGNTNRNVLGMVGDGYLNGTMLLSLGAIRHSFSNDDDKHNTVIHEFVHLVDKTDGAIDGVPEILLQNQYVIPWLDMVHQQISNIKTGDSDVDAYGITNKAEFFAVASEYFFERPDLLEQNHPELFAMLSSIYGTD